jgi:hypothetical protein
VNDKHSFTADKSFGATEKIVSAANMTLCAADKISSAALMIFSVADRILSATNKVSFDRITVLRALEEGFIMAVLDCTERAIS